MFIMSLVAHPSCSDLDASILRKVTEVEGDREVETVCSSISGKSLVVDFTRQLGLHLNCALISQR